VIMQSLATSSVDFAITNPDPALFNAMDRGLNIKLLAALTRNKPGDKVAAMLVRKDLIDSGKYHSPKDLKGLNVAIPANQSQFYVDLVMQKDGLSATDTNLTTLAPTDIIAAFASKNIDAAWTAEPIATLSVQQGLAEEVAVTGDLFTGAIGAALTVSPGFAQNQPEAAQRFVYATLRGHEEYYHAFIAKDIDKTATVQSMVNHSLIKDPKLFDVIGLASVDPVPTMDGVSWGTLQDYFVKIGLQQRKIDLEPYIDNSYMQNAAKRLGVQ
jgi:NitT/TauT family transport system substrate-binding protein